MSLTLFIAWPNAGVYQFKNSMNYLGFFFSICVWTMKSYRSFIINNLFGHFNNMQKILKHLTVFNFKLIIYWICICIEIIRSKNNESIIIVIIHERLHFLYYLGNLEFFFHQIEFNLKISLKFIRRAGCRRQTDLNIAFVYINHLKANK